MAKCGKCKETGVSVAHVRACYANTAMVAVPGLAGVTVPADGGYVGGNKQTPAPVRRRSNPSGMASPMVQQLTALRDEIKPFILHGTSRGNKVGYFASNASGVTKFYRIKKTTRGMVFIDVMASDETHPVQNMVSQIDILTFVLKDVEASQKLFAQELGQCYRCGRTLTDETSRKLGIGPICRG
jgi:hypothetical protein